MMKHKYKHAFFLILTALITLVILPAEAQETSRYSFHSGITNEHKAGQIGVGAQAGANTGITADYWTTDHNSISLNLTGFGKNFGIGGAYNWMLRNAFGSGEIGRGFVPFAGIGAIGVFGTESDNFKREGQRVALAVQVPLGLQWLPITQRFGLFGKISPSVELAPYGYFFIDADIGARFYF